MRKFIGNLRFAYVVYRVLFFCVFGWFAGFRDRKKYYFSQLATSGSSVMRAVNSTLEVEGAENLDPKKNYVMMANHRSYTDILVIFVATASVGRDVIFMSKKEIFKVPFLGTAMRSMGMVPVDRGNARKAMQSFLEADKAVKNGANLLVFPEGTRSKDGQLQELKKGGFMIAKRAGVEIAPFVIHGTEEFMPRGEFSIYPAKIRMKFLKPIATEGRSEQELMEMVSDAIKSEL